MTRLLYRYRNSGWVAVLFYLRDRERTGKILLDMIPRIYAAERRARITSG